MHSVVKPVKLRLHDDDLRTDRLRGIGYSWWCACGEHGSRCATWQQANFQRGEHMLSHPLPASGVNPPSSTGPDPELAA